MQYLIKILIGIFILILGIFLGNLLARWTKEELKSGEKYFKSIILLSFIGTIVTLIIKNDILFFTFLFIIIVTSRCLKKN
jgi:hypothetical protein